MQTTSALYQSILSNGNHWYETRLVIDGVGTYDEHQLFSVSTNIEMFHGTPAVGSAVAQEINVEMLLPNEAIPAMAVLRPQVRICDATRQSEWLPQGVFYIDTRERSKNDNGLDVLTIHGYDAMLKADQYFSSTTITGNSTDKQMVAAIASQMGISVDERTYPLMTHSYTVPLPTGYTCREVLGYIAAMYAGCFIISDAGKLRLVSMTDMPEETNYLIDNSGDAITFGGDRILV